MAIGFNEVDQYYTIADAAELILQDGAWSVGIWTYVVNNTGTNFQYLISNKMVGNNDSINIWLQEEDSSGTPNTWCTRVVDGDGTDSDILFSATATGADSTWRLIIVQRNTSDNEIQLWHCEVGAAATKEASAADTNFDAINGDDWDIGRRADADADRYYGSTRVSSSRWITL